MSETPRDCLKLEKEHKKCWKIRTSLASCILNSKMEPPAGPSAVPADWLIATAEVCRVMNSGKTIWKRCITWQVP